MNRPWPRPFLSSPIAFVSGTAPFRTICIVVCRDHDFLFPSRPVLRFPQAILCLRPSLLPPFCFTSTLPSTHSSTHPLTHSRIFILHTSIRSHTMSRHPHHHHVHPQFFASLSSRNLVSPDSIRNQVCWFPLTPSRCKDRSGRRRARDGTGV